MSNKLTAKSLLQERDIVLEVPTVEVKGFIDNITTIPDAKFPSSPILMTRANTFTKNATQIFFFDEKNQKENYIAVPNEFLFAPAKEDDIKKLMNKFSEWRLKNIEGQCHYMGSAIGSDPEIFCEDEKGEIVPAFKFLGSKEKPNKAQGHYHHNSIYWDGFQAEFDTYANSCMQIHGDSIHYGLQGLYNALKQHNPKAKLSSKTVFDIPMDMLKESAPEHVAFGCRPSFNAYGMKGDERPGTEVTYRSTGGHIHFGLGDKLASDEAGILKMVKALDAILGVACVSMFAKYDDPRRRQMYGLAGEYRRPKYGFEYRVLSNAWMFHPLIAHLVFDLARSVTTFGYKDFLKYWDCEEKETIRIINECDVKAAREVLKKNKSILIKLINVRYGNLDKADFVYDIFFNGMESVIRDPKDIENNWLLKPGQQWCTHCGSFGHSVNSAFVAQAKV